MPVLIGVAALGTEGAQVLSLHRQAQAAADSAAISVANYYASQKTANAWLPPLTSTQVAELATQAEAVAATYGFSSVSVNNPPASGNLRPPIVLQTAIVIVGPPTIVRSR